MNDACYLGWFIPAFPSFGGGTTVIRRVLAVSALLLCLGAPIATATPAFAQYGGTCGFVLTPTTVVAGQTVQVVGQNANPNELLVFTINGITIGTTTADADGNFSATLTIPADLPAGTYSVDTNCGNAVSSQSINVSSASANNGNASNASGNLPATGSNSLLFLRWALAFIAIGGLIVLATRRQRHHHSSHHS
jgi:5'-nucleotidase